MWFCWHTAAAVALLLVGLLIGTSGKDCDADAPPESIEARLERELLCNYDSDQRPVKNHSTTVTVSVRVLLKYFTYENNEETLTLHTWMVLSWMDEYLSWEPNDYGGITEMQINSYKIWTPELNLYNADISLNSGGSFYTICLLGKTGHVVCVPESTYSALCISRLKYWPYDTQNCTFRFGSWMHAGEKINFTKPTYGAMSKREDYQENHSWKILDITAMRDPGTLKCCPNETYPSLRYNLIIKRQSATAAAVIIIPAIVMVTLSMVTLLLDINTSERMYLPLVNMFCHYTYMNELNYVIPQHGDETALVVLFFRDSLLITAFIICLTILLKRLNIRRKAPPRWILSFNSVIYSGPARHIVFNAFDPSDLETVVTEDVEKQEQFDKKEWRKLCAFINNLSLFAVIITYAGLFLCLIP